MNPLYAASAHAHLECQAGLVHLTGSHAKPAKPAKPPRRPAALVQNLVLPQRAAVLPLAAQTLERKAAPGP